MATRCQTRVWSPTRDPPPIDTVTTRRAARIEISLDIIPDRATYRYKPLLLLEPAYVWPPTRVNPLIEPVTTRYATHLQSGLFNIPDHKVDRYNQLRI
jgi:hypothetical protein